MPLRDHFRPPLDNEHHWEGFHATWPVMIVANLNPKLPDGYVAAPRACSAASVLNDMPGQDVYEVLVFNDQRRSHVVAAVEIVSPANKDRPVHRRAFVAKCVSSLRERVSVAIVDIVTTHTQDLYGEMLDRMGQTDPTLRPETTLLFAAAFRTIKRENQLLLETWRETMSVGRPLPTVPLWLADDLAVPLELQESYEQSCNILNIR
jgi:hypothetical protein